MQGTGSIPPTPPDPIKLLDSFGRLRRGQPSTGDLSACGAVLMVCGVVPVIAGIYLGDPARMWMALVGGGVLVSLGVFLIVSGVVINARMVHHRWTGDGTQLAIDGQCQCAHIQSIELPHGTKGREIWLGVWVKHRCYPHPLKVLRRGAISGCHLGLGHEYDVGKRFRVVVYSIVPEAAAKIERYYDKATKSGKYPGIARRAWPSGSDTDELFAFSCVRKAATEPGGRSADVRQTVSAGA